MMCGECWLIYGSPECRCQLVSNDYKFVRVS